MQKSVKSVLFKILLTSRIFRCEDYTGDEMRFLRRAPNLALFVVQVSVESWADINVGNLPVLFVA